MMVNTVLGHLRKLQDVDFAAIQTLLLVADCGPHFRSKENVAHFCVTLPRTLGISVEIAWLGECHGKSGVDRCFGWCNTWISRWILKNPIFNLADLVNCFRSGARQQMLDDPSGATIHILIFAPGDHRPSKRFVLVSDEFKVSRTYSIVGKPSKHAEFGATLRNKVFSDLTTSTDFMWSIQEKVPADVEPWRKGYYDKERSWEASGPQPGEQNSITRRYTAQKSRTCSNMPSRKPTFLDRVSAKALSLKKAAAKKYRKQRRLRADSSDSSTSSSSSSSSASASDNVSSEE